HLLPTPLLLFTFYSSVHHLLGIFPTGAHKLGTQLDLDALVAQLFEKHGSQRGFISFQNSAGPLKHSRFHAEPVHGLRHLNTDRPSADDDQRTWRPFQLEDILAGQVADLREALESRRRRPRPRT